jgi:hypothetical protein
MKVLMALPLTLAQAHGLWRVLSDITCQLTFFAWRPGFSTLSGPSRHDSQAQEKENKAGHAYGPSRGFRSERTCAAPTATSWDQCGCASACVSKTKETSKPLHLASRQPSPSPPPSRSRARTLFLRECLPSIASFSFPSFTQPARHIVDLQCPDSSRPQDLQA